MKKEEKKTSLVSNALIWFGAAVSIAEIEAGFTIGGDWLALLAGHVIGGFMLFAAGSIGGITGRNAMESSAAAFGTGGMRMFALLNIVQLVGWTAVMIAQGGAAVSALTGLPFMPPCLALAVLIGVWMFIALGDRLRLATIAMGALALLAIALTIRLLGAGSAVEVKPIGFGNAFEISIAMPLSWLPLISDYTSKAARPRAASAVSAIVYTAVSVWMYALGMLIAKVGADSIADGIVRSGIGAVGLVVVMFSTVTTTFLDAYSSGESAKAMFPKAPMRAIGVGVCAIGGALAIAGVMDHYIDFLLLVSSVFAPMATVLLVDRYLVKRGFAAWNLAAWALGVAAHRLAGSFPLGPSLCSIVVAALVSLAGGLCNRRHA